MKKRTQSSSKGVSYVSRNFVKLCLLWIFSLSSLMIQAQDNQRISVDLRGESLESTLWYLQNRTKFIFMYATEDIANITDISVRAKNKTITEILDECLEGTNLTAKCMNGAIAVMAIAKQGGLLHAPDMYMDKIAVGPKAKGAIDINKSPKENMLNVAKALGKDPSQLTVVLLERERHQYIVDAAREVGAKIRFISDGDVAPALAVAFEANGIDMVYGKGGAPEGVLAAAAIKCLGGDMQARLVPETDEEIRRVHEMGQEDVNQVLTLDDLVSTDDVCFIATGVTNGDLLRGVQVTDKYYITHTCVLRGVTGTARFIETYHDRAKKHI